MAALNETKSVSLAGSEWREERLLVFGFYHHPNSAH